MSGDNQDDKKQDDRMGDPSTVQNSPDTRSPNKGGDQKER